MRSSLSGSTGLLTASKIELAEEFTVEFVEFLREQVFV